MRYRQLVFDIDGTLLDTEYAILHSLQEVLCRQCGRQVPVEALTFALGIPGADALAMLAVPDIPAALLLWERRMAAYTGHVQLFPGVRQTLFALERAGCVSGIVTSKTRAEYRQDFVPYGIADAFSAVVCAGDTARHKPHPDPLLRYMELTGTTAEQLLYIGDSVYDSRCAQSAGVDFALACWGTRRRDIPARYTPETPQALLELLVS